MYMSSNTASAMMCPMLYHCSRAAKTHMARQFAFNYAKRNQFYSRIQQVSAFLHGQKCQTSSHFNFLRLSLVHSELRGEHAWTRHQTARQPQKGKAAMGSKSFAHWKTVINVNTYLNISLVTSIKKEKNYLHLLTIPSHKWAKVKI